MTRPGFGVAVTCGIFVFALGVYGLFLSGPANDAPPQQCLIEDGPGRVWISAGVYRLGAQPRYPEERQPYSVETAGFWIDQHEVTNAQFAQFTDETGYVTRAEQRPDPDDYPGIDPQLLVAGSAVFGVRSGDGFWWRFVSGANWKKPYGRGSSIRGLDHFPVVHIAYGDALAYALWAGASLPTEEEWEIAARGSNEGTTYEWGEAFRPDRQWRANTWQGPFPVVDTGDDGYTGLAPIGCYEANENALYDMTGNVWEWTSSPFDASAMTGTIRGGSYLCSSDFCARFRPSARQAQERDFSASHIGFRTIRREP